MTACARAQASKAEREPVTVPHAPSATCPAPRLPGLSAPTFHGSPALCRADATTELAPRAAQWAQRGERGSEEGRLQDILPPTLRSSSETQATPCPAGGLHSVIV